MSNLEQGMSNDKVADRMSNSEFRILNVEGNSRPFFQVKFSRLLHGRLSFNFRRSACDVRHCIPPSIFDIRHSVFDIRYLHRGSHLAPHRNVMTTEPYQSEKHPQPWWRRLDRWVPLTREGKIWLLFSLGLFATGLFRGINLILLLASILIATLLYNLWLSWRQLWPVRGRRIADREVFAATPTIIILEVYNARRQSLHGLQLNQQEKTRPLIALPGRRVTHSAIPLTFPRRGRETLEAFQVTSGYPLGLARCRRTIAPAEEIVILPRLGLLRRGVLRRYLQQHSPTLGQARTVPRRHPSAQTDFHGMRTFQPGDSPRWIHWRTTARRGELTVKEFEETPSDNLILIVDPYKPATLPGESEREDANLETVLSLAATICWEWCRQKGDRLVLGIAGAEPTVCGGVTGTTLALEQLGLLALEPGCAKPKIPELLERLAAADLPAAPVLLISSHACEFVVEMEQGLHRTLAAIDVAAGEHEDFYEPII
jgi:uncharacterized protein (DUF58 family)